MTRTRLRPEYSCCHAPVVGGVDPQHKCNLGRGGVDAKAVAACGNVRLRPAQGGAHPAPSKPAGRDAEDAMAAALTTAGFRVMSFGAFLTTVALRDVDERVVVREYPWGLTLPDERRYKSDFCVVLRNLLIESDGGAHRASEKRRQHDVLRTQAATGAGYRVVSVLPEQVHNGEALALVRAAITGGAK